MDELVCLLIPFVEKSRTLSTRIASFTGSFYLPNKGYEKQTGNRKRRDYVEEQSDFVTPSPKPMAFQDKGPCCCLIVLEKTQPLFDEVNTCREEGTIVGLSMGNAPLAFLVRRIGNPGKRNFLPEMLGKPSGWLLGGHKVPGSSKLQRRVDPLVFFAKPSQQQLGHNSVTQLHMRRNSRAVTQTAAMAICNHRHGIKFRALWTDCMLSGP